MCSSRTFLAARCRACIPPRQVHHCCSVWPSALLWRCLRLEECTRPVVLQNLACHGASAFCKPRLERNTCDQLDCGSVHIVPALPLHAVPEALMHQEPACTCSFVGWWLLRTTRCFQVFLWPGNHAPGACIGGSLCCEVTRQLSA